MFRKVAMAVMVAVVIFTTGCQSRGFKESVAESDALELQVRNADVANEYKFVKNSSKWYVPKVRHARKDTPDWCYSPQQLGVFKDAPIKLVMQY